MENAMRIAEETAIDSIPSDLEANTKKILTKINQGQYDLLCLGTRKGSSLYEMSGITPKENLKVRSDMWLRSADAHRFFKEQPASKVCLFDDIKRFGRNMERWENRIKEECDATEVDAYALARHLKLPESEALESKCYTHSDLDDIAIRELLLFYKRGIPCSLMPRTRLQPLQDDPAVQRIWNALEVEGFKAVLGEERHAIEEESNCWRMVYTVLPTEFKDVFGSHFARVVGGAYIEAFFYGSDGVKLRFLPHVFLNPLYTDEIIDIICRFFESFSGLFSDAERLPSMARGENAYIQNFLLKYCMSALLLRKKIDFSQIGCSFDDDLHIHFGDCWHDMLNHLKKAIEDTGVLECILSNLGADKAHFRYTELTSNLADPNDNTYEIGNLAGALEESSNNDRANMSKDGSSEQERFFLCMEKESSLYRTQVWELSRETSRGNAVCRFRARKDKNGREYYATLIHGGELSFVADTMFRDLFRCLDMVLVRLSGVVESWEIREKMYRAFVGLIGKMLEKKPCAVSFSDRMNKLLDKGEHGVYTFDSKVDSLLRIPNSSVNTLFDTENAKEDFLRMFDKELLVALTKAAEV
jgi:hypothetical protein